MRRQAFARELEGLRSGDEVAIAEAEDLHADAIAVFDEAAAD